MRRKQALVALLGLVAASNAAAANADASDLEAASCIADHTDGQVLTRSGKFLEARVKFQHCDSPACPGPVQSDCHEFSWAVEQLVPTVRLTVKEYDGRDVSGLSVQLDGAPLNVERQGQLIEVNPGPHEFRFATKDHRSVVQTVFAKIAEKNREVLVRVPPPIRLLQRPQPIEVALAGVGVVGLGLFVGFGLSGYSLQQDLEKCAPYCQDRQQADRMRSRYLVADVSLGMGLLSLGTATYLYVKRSQANQASASKPVHGSSTGTAAIIEPFRF